MNGSPKPDVTSFGRDACGRVAYINPAGGGAPQAMSTPAMVAASMLKLMVVCLGVFWIVSFSVGRLFIFYEAYTAFLSVLKDEEWLRVQCASPEFYSNMRQHTELCSTVMLNAARSPLLIALNEVASTAHLCGRHSCADALSELSRAGWPVIVSVVVTLLIAPSILVRVARALVVHQHARADDGDHFYLQHNYRAAWDDRAHHHHHGKLL